MLQVWYQKQEGSLIVVPTTQAGIMLTARYHAEWGEEAFSAKDLEIKMISYI